jgi:hypothetical protein
MENNAALRDLLLLGFLLVGLIPSLSRILASRGQEKMIKVYLSASRPLDSKSHSAKDKRGDS